MAKGINKVILIGTLGKDVEFRFIPNGDGVANFSIATNESWKDKQTGEQHERTEWHRIVFYKRLAEICRDYLKKGSKIYVEGSLRTRKWQDKNGQDVYTTEIIGNEMQMLDVRNGQSNNSNDSSFSSVSHDNNYRSSTAATPSADVNDDVPF